MTVLEQNTSTKFVPAPWQLEDLAHLAELDSSANWSEMGCFKTSSVLWLAQAKTRKIVNPSIMIITTPSGKGTYYEAIPQILPEFTLIDVTTQGAFLLDRDNNRIKIDDVLPEVIEVPHIILTHYHVFGKTNKGEPERGPDKKVLKNPVTGRVIMKPWTHADYLMERRYDFIALDEAHRIKNPNTRWTNNIKKLGSTYRHVMTGTGFINRPDEIWSPLNFLDSYHFSSYWAFRDRFCEIDVEDGYQKVVGIKQENKEAFRELVRTFGVRRTLTEVMPHIKEPLRVRRDVELNSVQRTMYEDIKHDLMLLDQKQVPIYSPNVISALSRMRQICVATPEKVDDYYDEILQKRVQVIKLVEPSSKLDDVEELLEELQWDEDAKQQVVIFSCFKDPLFLLSERFKAKFDPKTGREIKPAIPYIWMKEGDSDQVRYDKWFKQFPTKQHRVFMSTLQLGSESINLSTAQHVVFLDRSWSPKDNSQGIGRVRRPGQEGQPVVINIEAYDTTDQKLELTNYRKQGWFNEIFGDE